MGVKIFQQLKDLVNMSDQIDIESASISIKKGIFFKGHEPGIYGGGLSGAGEENQGGCAGGQPDYRPDCRLSGGNRGGFPAADGVFG